MDGLKVQHEQRNDIYVAGLRWKRSETESNVTSRSWLLNEPSVHSGVVYKAILVVSNNSTESDDQSNLLRR